MSDPTTSKHARLRAQHTLRRWALACLVAGCGGDGGVELRSHDVGHCKGHGNIAKGRCTVAETDGGSSDTTGSTSSGGEEPSPGPGPALDSSSGGPTTTDGTPPASLTGTHWPDPSEFSTLATLGYDFAITMVDPSWPPGWDATLDAAEAAGIRLIVGAWPPPYTPTETGWGISDEGVALLDHLHARSELVLALFVFNEPYWTDPIHGGTSECGVYSAADLRGLRASIREVWPEAKIYHDLGGPAEWAPGGGVWAAYPCIGDKYADQTDVADYVGVFAEISYPFESWGYEKEAALDFVTAQAQYVADHMSPAQAINLNQSFRCSTCGPTGYPSNEEILDWNCATREIPNVAGVSWYVWRQGIYEDYLANHPEQWDLTGADACPP